MAVTLYAISGAGAAASILYTINPINGSLISTIGNTGLTHIVGLTVRHSDHAIFAVCNDDHNLYTLDPLTAAPTLIGALGTIGGAQINVPGMAMSPDGTVIYGAGIQQSSPFDEYLISINPSTGAATSLGVTFTQNYQAGFSYDNMGRLWFKDAQEFLYIVDPSGPTYTLMATDITGGSIDNPFAINPVDNTMHSSRRTGGNTQYWNIDPNLDTTCTTVPNQAATLTFIGNMGVGNISGLAFDWQCPLTKTETFVASGSPTTWTYTDAASNSLTFSKSGAGNCTNFSLSGTLSDGTTFNMPTPDTCTCYTWTFSTTQVTATVYASPGAPTSLSAVCSGDETTALSWTAAPGATSYKIYKKPVDPDTAISFYYVDTSLVTSYNDTTNESWTYAIAAVNGLSELGPFSNESTLMKGRFVTKFANISTNTPAGGLAIQTDDKWVVCGAWDNTSVSPNSHSVIARYNTDGTLDTSFGTNGKVEITNGTSSSLSDVLILGSGKILVCGYSSVGSGTYLARLNTDGSLDTSFGSSGITNTTFGDTGRKIAVQSDGSIVVAGYKFDSGRFKYHISRYSSSGVLDTGFGTSGRTMFNISAISGGYDLCQSVVIQPGDQRIVVHGGSQVTDPGPINRFNPSFARLNTDGTLDTAGFGAGTGKVLVNLNSLGIPRSYTGQKVKLQSDGKIVGVGFGSDTSSRFTVVRLNTDGTLDTGLASTGVVTTNFGGGGTPSGGSQDLQILSGDKLLVCGFRSNGFTDNRMALVKYNNDGSLDTGFGTGGILYYLFNDGTVSVPGNGGSPFANHIEFMSSGEIVLSGNCYVQPGCNPPGAFDGQQMWALIRLNSDGSVDTPC